VLAIAALLATVWLARYAYVNRSRFRKKREAEKHYKLVKVVQQMEKAVGESQAILALPAAGTDGSAAAISHLSKNTREVAKTISALDLSNGDQVVGWMSVLGAILGLVSAFNMNTGAISNAIHSIRAIQWLTADKDIEKTEENPLLEATAQESAAKGVNWRYIRAGLYAIIVLMVVWRYTPQNVKDKLTGTKRNWFREGFEKANPLSKEKVRQLFAPFTGRKGQTPAHMKKLVKNLNHAKQAFWEEYKGSDRRRSEEEGAWGLMDDGFSSAAEFYGYIEDNGYLEDMFGYKWMKDDFYRYIENRYMEVLEDDSEHESDYDEYADDREKDIEDYVERKYDQQINDTDGVSRWGGKGGNKDWYAKPKSNPDPKTKIQQKPPKNRNGKEKFKGPLLEEWRKLRPSQAQEKIEEEKSEPQAPNTSAPVRDGNGIVIPKEIRPVTPDKIKDARSVEFECKSYRWGEAKDSFVQCVCGVKVPANEFGMHSTACIHLVNLKAKTFQPSHYKAQLTSIKIESCQSVAALTLGTQHVKSGVFVPGGLLTCEHGAAPDTIYTTAGVVNPKTWSGFRIGYDLMYYPVRENLPKASHTPKQGPFISVLDYMTIIVNRPKVKGGKVERLLPSIWFNAVVLHMESAETEHGPDVLAWFYLEGLQDLQAGDSGSPAYDQDWKLIGLLTAYSASTKIGAVSILPVDAEKAWKKVDWAKNSSSPGSSN
jgi:hypothetical protein